MVIVHSIRSLDRQTGGAPVTVLRLVQTAAQRWPQQTWQLLAEPGTTPLLDRVELAANARWLPQTQTRGAAPFYRTLQAQHHKTPVALIHDHGIWLPNNHRLAQAARQFSIPRVVSTHGMLEPWAWQYKSWKKRLAWQLFQRRDMATAQALHATSEGEAQRLYDLFPQIPIATIPWGVDLPPAHPGGEPTAGDRRRVLFLSRLHPKKGLITLVEAWAQVPSQGWELVIAGPDELGHRALVEQRVQELKLPNVVFVGPVEGDRKWAYYRQAEIFVLPTHSENFGLVVAEALACGTPVITTQAAPWADLIRHRCGWWIPTGTQFLRHALGEALSKPPLELQAMGAAGIKLIQERYTWPRVAERMVELYDYLLQKKSASPPPWLNDS